MPGSISSISAFSRVPPILANGMGVSACDLSGLEDSGDLLLRPSLQPAAIVMPYDRAAAIAAVLPHVVAGNETRARMAADWLLMIYVPAWLRAASISPNGLDLEGIARVARAAWVEMRDQAKAACPSERRLP